MDREKLIDLLENEAIATNTGYVEVPLLLFSEIITLLKEQEAKTVIKIAKRFNDCDLTGYCPFCSRPLIKDWAGNYCGYCGKPILWEGR